MGIQRIVIAGLGAVLLFVTGTPHLRGQQDQKTPARELVQYVRDASRLGLTNAQIEQNATKAGWPVATVREALSQASDTNGSATAMMPRPPITITSPTVEKAAPAAESTSGVEIPTLSADEYRIGAGDVIRISVWKEPEASVDSTVVRPDGKIGLPLLKELEVVGLTTKEAETIITKGLTRFITTADVTVVVAAINSKKIYMVGAVKKEGPIPFTYRMTVMQALSEAGGLNDYAKRRKIYILRTMNGKDYRLPFDYEAVLKGERMELNIPLLSGDTVVVPH